MLIISPQLYIFKAWQSENIFVKFWFNIAHKVSYISTHACVLSVEFTRESPEPYSETGRFHSLRTLEWELRDFSWKVTFCPFPINPSTDTVIRLGKERKGWEQTRHLTTDRIFLRLVLCWMTANYSGNKDCTSHKFRTWELWGPS